MFGQVHVKRAVKFAAGRAAVAAAALARRSAIPQACLLVYHRVANIGFVDPRLDDWNVPPRTFERQLAVLSETGEIVPLLELPGRLQAPRPGERPLVCLTFDDGYANFLHHVVPLLIRYCAPATLFVPTSAVEGTGPMPFDRWALKNQGRVSEDAWRPMRWSELEQCLDSGFVSVGSHSHWHRNGRECQPAELQEEAERSREVLSARLGRENIRSYAYPYGSSRLGQVTPDYVAAVRNAGYELAVSTDLGLATGSSDRHLLPRVEAHPLDGPGVLRAKIHGSLAPYYWTDRLRRAHRG